MAIRDSFAGKHTSSALENTHSTPIAFEAVEPRLLLSADPWTFAVTGDSRGTSDTNAVNTIILTDLANQIVAEGVDLVMFSGDLVYGSSSAIGLRNQLTAWQDVMQPVYDAGIAVYAGRGNHDTQDNLAELTVWNDVFSGEYALPTNGPSGEVGATYSVSHENALIVSVDQYVSEHMVNQPWLDGQFAANNNPHVFVFGHEPAFAAAHADSLDNFPNNRNAFWRSIANEGGRTYFAGHDHFYDHARADKDGDPDNDIHQYILGTAGAPSYDWDGVYGGDNGAYTIHNIAHRPEFGESETPAYGYVLGEVDDLDVTLTWMERQSPGEYLAGDTWTYSVEPPQGLFTVDGVLGAGEEYLIVEDSPNDGAGAVELTRWGLGFDETIGEHGTIHGFIEVSQDVALYAGTPGNDFWAGFWIDADHNRATDWDPTNRVPEAGIDIVFEWGSDENPHYNFWGVTSDVSSERSNRVDGDTAYAGRIMEFSCDFDAFVAEYTLRHGQVPGQIWDIAARAAGQTPTAGTAGDVGPLVTVDLVNGVLGAVGDRVWDDLDGDGVQDAVEPGLAGVQVSLHRMDDTLVGTTTSDATGAYGFGDLVEGQYYVVFHAPQGYEFTIRDRGDNRTDSDADEVTGRSAAFPLAEGEQISDIDAGLTVIGTFEVDGVINSHEDYVIVVDPDNDNPTGIVDMVRWGIAIDRNAGDAGMVFAFIEVIDNPNDEFTVDIPTLAAGGEDVGVIYGGFWLDVDHDPATSWDVDNDWPDLGMDAAVEWGLNDEGYNFWGVGGDIGEQGSPIVIPDDGETAYGAHVLEMAWTLPAFEAEYALQHDGEPLGPIWDVSARVAAHVEGSNYAGDVGDILTFTASGELLGSIAGRVWQDSSADGIQDEGEVGVADVDVRLYNAEGALVDETTSAADGAYAFTALLEGLYIVQVVGPEGRGFSPEDQGDDDTVDSDVEPVSGLMAPVVLAEGANEMNRDAGLVQNIPPVANNEVYVTDEDTVLTVNADSGVLDNDEDPDGEGLVAVLTHDVEHGSVLLYPDGSFEYAPDTDYNGQDSFIYEAVDDRGGRTAATVTININPVNDTPMVVEDAYEVAEDSPLNVAASSGVLANDSDPEGIDLTAALDSDVSHGSLAFSPDGSFTYTPDADFNGADSFTYVASDGQLDSPVTTVTITVTPVNDAPLAVDQAIAATEDTPYAGTAGATDVDADGLTFSVVAGPANGALAMQTDGSFTYTPAANWHGTDGFTFNVNDGQADSPALGVVTVTVAPVNDAPVVSDQSLMMENFDPIEIAVAGSDVETASAALTFQLLGQGGGGSAVMNGDVITYTPAFGFHGLDTIQYTATDTGDPAGQHANPGDVTSEPGTISVLVPTPLDAKGRLSFVDADGDLVRLRIKGGGSGQVLFAPEDGGNASKIIVQDVATTSSVVLKVKRGPNGDGMTTIGGIEVIGSVKRIQAKKAVLAGDVHVNGWLGKLFTGDVVGASRVRVDSQGSKPSVMRFGRITSLVIDSATPIKSLRAEQWIAGALIAPWVGSIKIRGSFGADVSLTSVRGSKNRSLARFSAGGVINGGVWTIAGGGGSVRAGASNGGWTATFGGDVKSFKTIHGTIDSHVTGIRFGSVTLGNPETHNNGTSFGLKAESIKRLTVKYLGAPKTYPNLDDPLESIFVDDFAVVLV